MEWRRPGVEWMLLRPLYGRVHRHSARQAQCDRTLSGASSPMYIFRYRNCHAHSQLNITNSFNYRELLLREKWNGSTPAVTALRPLFVQYQINSSERYLHDLREHMHTKVAICFVRFSPHPSVVMVGHIARSSHVVVLQRRRWWLGHEAGMRLRASRAQRGRRLPRGPSSALRGHSA